MSIRSRAEELREARRRRTESDGHAQELQIILREQYRLGRLLDGPLPAFREVEFSTYSQNGEDGILLLLFSILGTRTRRAVEICAGDGIECNAANLVVNHGWDALLIDGDEDLIARGRRFYARRNNAWKSSRLPPHLLNAWVSAENVNGLVSDAGFDGAVDLLSLDMDGIDYWVWDALTCITPRVVVAEFNNRWGPEESVTVPYDSAFRTRDPGPNAEGYFGASLAALSKLAESKGLCLVGTNAPATNAFFVDAEEADGVFPTKSVAECLDVRYAVHQRNTKGTVLADETRFPIVHI